MYTRMAHGQSPIRGQAAVEAFLWIGVGVVWNYFIADVLLVGLHCITVSQCMVLTFMWPASWQILIIKPTRCTNFSNLFLEWNSTRFGHFLCPSSGVFHFTHSNGICHTGLLTACEHPPTVYINQTVVPQAETVKYFGLHFDKTSNLEEPRGNETQATQLQNSRHILAHWQTFPPIVGKQASHL